VGKVQIGPIADCDGKCVSKICIGISIVVIFCRRCVIGCALIGIEALSSMAVYHYDRRAELGNFDEPLSVKNQCYPSITVCHHNHYGQDQKAVVTLQPSHYCHRLTYPFSRCVFWFARIICLTTPSLHSIRAPLTMIRESSAARLLSIGCWK